MNQREQFEQWIVAKGLRFNSADYFMWLAWQDAQAAKDAELQELREKYEGLTTLFHSAFAERNALCNKIDVLEANMAKCRELFKYQKAWTLSSPGFVKCFIKLGELYKQAEEACGL